MKDKIKFIYGDLQRTAGKEEIFLDTYGTNLDLERHHMKFEGGKRYWFWRDDGDAQGNNDPLLFTGVVRLDKKSGKWIAKIDQDSIQHYSESEFKNTHKADEIDWPIQ